MSLTDDQHREVGRILGYPPCCVEAFVTGGTARSRGVVCGPDRSCEDLRRTEIEVGEVIGHEWENDASFCYVPCEACVGSVGYRTYDEHFTMAMIALRVLVKT